MPDTPLSFPNRRGEQLSARLALPVDGAPVAYALFAHCFTCSKDLKAVTEIVRALGRAGIATLRFDFTGLGESEGDFADTTLSHNVDDLLDATDFLERRYAAPGLLIGHSLGGAAVLQAAGRMPSVRAVATIGAPFEANHVTHLFSTSERDEAYATGAATATIAGRTFRVRKEFFEDLEEHSMQRHIRDLGRPLLVLHSPTDNVVGVDNARLIFEAARHPKSFLSLHQADHLLSRRQDARFAGEMIASWAAAYLGRDQAPAWQADIQDNRTVVRTETGLRTEAMSNGFGLLLDEPVAVGGTNTGPTPYDLLATALAACTSMTLRLYADRKRWPLAAVMVEVDHRKVHAEDSQGSETTPARLDLFERHILVEGPLDEQQRARLLEIADRCPVHRTLWSQARIVTHLGERSAPREASPYHPL